MDKKQFLALMKFPVEWEAWGMYPDELATIQIEGYYPGHEEGSEHDRNGAFHWWVKNNPSKDQIEKLIRLTFLDPDYLMADDARRYFARCEAFDADHQCLIQQLEIGRGPKMPFSWTDA